MGVRAPGQQLGDGERLAGIVPARALHGSRSGGRESMLVYAPEWGVDQALGHYRAPPWGRSTQWRGHREDCRAREDDPGASLVPRDEPAAMRAVPASRTVLTLSAGWATGSGTPWGHGSRSPLPGKPRVNPPNRCPDRRPFTGKERGSRDRPSSAGSGSGPGPDRAPPRGASPARSGRRYWSLRYPMTCGCRRRGR